MEIGLEWLRSYFKFIGNRSRIIFQCKSIHFEYFSWYKLPKWEKLKIQFQISTSSNKSRPGTPFKMCSRSWEYGRFQYHQKLLAQKWSCANSKYTYLMCVLSPFDINCHECRNSIPWEFICGIQLKSNSAAVQDRRYAWNWVLLVSWKRISWEFVFSVHGCWRRTPETNFQEIRFRLFKKKV